MQYVYEQTNIERHSVDHPYHSIQALVPTTRHSSSYLAWDYNNQRQRQLTTTPHDAYDNSTHAHKRAESRRHTHL